MIGVGAQTLLKASQAVRSTVPARSLLIIAGPPKNKVPRVERIFIYSIFIAANFAYPVYVLNCAAERNKAALLKSES